MLETHVQSNSLNLEVVFLDCPITSASGMCLIVDGTGEMESRRNSKDG